MEGTMPKGWIGVDLDGTLAHYDGWKGVEHIGEPIPAMLARVKQWLTEGKDVRIFTARVGETDGRSREETWRAAQFIWAWTKKYLGVELRITATKDLQMAELWDDRCVQVITNTGVRVDGKP
jgi:hypothetical protein